jgi:hypothetical protein
VRYGTVSASAVLVGLGHPRALRSVERGAAHSRELIMMKVGWWLAAAYLCAFLIMAAVVAVLSLTGEDTATILDRDVRR